MLKDIDIESQSDETFVGKNRFHFYLNWEPVSMHQAIFIVKLNSWKNTEFFEFEFYQVVLNDENEETKQV